MNIKRRKKIIGLLGGIGPQATGEFYLALIKKLQEKGKILSNKDFPQIVINSIPAPELIKNDISEKNLKVYIKGLKELEKLRVDFIVMICNSVHLFYEKLQKEIKLPIIDLRKEVKKFLFKKGVKSIVILGTPLTIKKGLYKFKEIRFFNLDEKEIKLLEKVIFNFNRGIEKEKQIEIIKSIAKKYLNRKVQFILLGCTEIASMLKNENLPKINPMEILAEAILRKIK